MPIFVVGEGTGDIQSGLFLPMQTDVSWLRQAVMGALLPLTYPNNWREEADVAVSYAVEACSQMFAEYQFLLNPVPIGMIEAFAVETAPPGWLACDGSEYTEAQYPELYAAIADTFKDTEGHLVFTPLIYPGQTIIQSGLTPFETDIPFPSSNIYETVTLAVENLPSHHHTIPLTATTLAFEPGEITVQTPVPFFTQDTGDTGAGVPFSAFAPYYSLYYFIYAGRA